MVKHFTYQPTRATVHQIPQTMGPSLVAYLRAVTIWYGIVVQVDSVRAASGKHSPPVLKQLSQIYFLVHG